MQTVLCGLVGGPCAAETDEVVPLEVNVSSMDGPICTINADQTWRIYDVKMAIERKSAFQRKEQKLLISEIECGDNQLLKSFVPEGSSALEIRVERVLDAAGWLRLSRKDPWALKAAPKQAIKTIVERDGLQLQCARDEFKSDADIVLKAVRQNGLALVYAEKSLQANRAIVAAAVKQNEEALQYAADELRSDPAIVRLLRKTPGVVTKSTPGQNEPTDSVTDSTTNHPAHNQQTLEEAALSKHPTHLAEIKTFNA
eukprot:gnl/MRDRNA2_/MRDRNA2_124919_c0_seq1.p1 gnl/MRDRNA2_/MRDRNA2_124919_c0~~gnl/MRDRNA2_/MRDRNA2_124919_c0_seq1.p1  ORF type:complete len:256 (-),score=57.83 gnl/MRDRNA2_/MRDRNA2_124919_c0_seq1:137-904(-)